MIVADTDLLDKLSEQAKHSPRKRTTYNFHKTPGDPIHRMLNAMQPGTYIPPHKHENPDKREAFWVLRGKIALIIFNESGHIRDHLILSPDNGNYGTELSPRAWHTLICLQENSVAFEVKDGPWDPSNDKIYAPWAPKEGEPNDKNYLSELMTKLKLKNK